MPLPPPSRLRKMLEPVEVSKGVEIMICSTQAASFLARHDSWKKKEQTSWQELVDIRDNLCQGANYLDSQIESKRIQTGEGFMDSEEHAHLSSIVVDMRKDIETLEIEAKNKSLEHEVANLKSKLRTSDDSAGAEPARKYPKLSVQPPTIKAPTIASGEAMEATNATLTNNNATANALALKATLDLISLTESTAAANALTKQMAKSQTDPENLSLRRCMWLFKSTTADGPQIQCDNEFHVPFTGLKRELTEGVFGLAGLKCSKHRAEQSELKNAKAADAN